MLFIIKNIFRDFFQKDTNQVPIFRHDPEIEKLKETIDINTHEALFRQLESSQGYKLYKSYLATATQHAINNILTRRINGKRMSKEELQEEVGRYIALRWCYNFVDNIVNTISVDIDAPIEDTSENIKEKLSEFQKQNIQL